MPIRRVCCSDLIEHFTSRLTYLSRSAAARASASSFARRAASQAS
ncbi:hypothetical protein ABZ912_27050 [Nonomuraea angiospora]